MIIRGGGEVWSEEAVKEGVGGREDAGSVGVGDLGVRVSDVGEGVFIRENRVCVGRDGVRV